MEEPSIKEYNIKIFKDFCNSSVEKYVLGDNSEEYIQKKKIAIIDCDGVVSNGESLYTEDGKFLKSYGCYDKEMMKFFSNIGWEFEFVSDDKKGFNITKKRISDLGYELFNYSDKERLQLIKDYKDKIGYDIIVFIGDSLSDIPSLIEADYSGTCNNAPDLVKTFCDYVSPRNGGNGAVADIMYNLHHNFMRYE